MIVQVAKEHLGYLSKNPPTMIKPNSTSLSDPTYLHSLLQKVRTGEHAILKIRLGLMINVDSSERDQALYYSWQENGSCWYFEQIALLLVVHVLEN